MTPCYAVETRKTARALTGHYDRALAPVGLDTPRFSILRALDHLGPVSTTRLAAALELDRSTMVRNVAALKRSRFVKLGADADDRRATIVSLAPTGAAVLRRAEPKWRRAQEELEGLLGPLGGAQFLGLLQALRKLLPDEKRVPARMSRRSP